MIDEDVRGLFDLELILELCTEVYTAGSEISAVAEQTASQAVGSSQRLESHTQRGSQAVEAMFGFSEYILHGLDSAGGDVPPKMCLVDGDLLLCLGVVPFD